MKKILVPGLITGIVMLVTSLVASPLLNFIFPTLQAEYTSINIFRSYSDPLMLYVFVHPILLGFIYAWVWTKTKDIWVLLLLGLPGMLISYSTFQISLTMVLSWTLVMLAEIFAASLVLAKFKK